MANVSYSMSIQGGGLSIQKTITRTADHPNPYGPITVPVAKILTAWIKSDANTGNGTLAGGHGYSNGTYDVFWTGGRRYGVPGVVVTNGITLDGGTGDDFPANGTSTVAVHPRTTINTAIDGDASQFVALSLESTNTSSVARGHISLVNAALASIEEIDLVANCPAVYDLGSGIANVFTGDPIAYSYVSNESTTEEATISILSLEDSTP